MKSQEILTSLPRFDLITLTFHENSKLLEIWGSNPRFGRSKFFFSCFFIFKFFTQDWVSLILTSFWYLVLFFRKKTKKKDALKMFGVYCVY